ncbi:MAG: hypothetical protein AAF797_15520 [Planctomycetota bacterium]
MASPTAEVKRFECPTCGQRFKWKPEVVGRRVKCPCGERFRVPDLSAKRAGATGGAGAGVGAGGAGGGRRVVKPAAVEPKPEADDWLSALSAAESGDAVAPVAYEPAVEPARLAVPASGAGVLERRVDAMTPVERDSEKDGRLGVKIAGVGVLAHVGGMGLMVLGMVGLLVAVAGATTPGGVQQTATESLWLYGLGAVGMVMGPLLGLAAPAHAGRNSILACLACFGGIIAVAVGLAVMQAGILLFGLGLIAIVVLYVMIFAFFMQYFADLAAHIGRPNLSALALTLRKALFTLVGVGFVAGITFIALPTAQDIASMLQGVASLVWSVAYLVMAVAIGWHAVRW